MDPIQTENYKDYTINIYIDNNPINPRENDNCGKMICFHKRYDLGDKHDYNSKDYNSWDEISKAITKDNDVAVILPLYLYDHSGITINTTGFSCSWDSGQVGFIFATKDLIRDVFGIKNVTKKHKDKAKNILLAEVKIYDKYIRGEYYGYSITDPDGKDDKSCWGFDDIDATIDDVKIEIDGLIEENKNAENPNQLLMDLNDC